MISHRFANGTAGICLRCLLNVRYITLSEDKDIGEYVADYNSDVDEDDGHKGDDEGSHDE